MSWKHRHRNHATPAALTRPVIGAVLRDPVIFPDAGQPAVAFARWQLTDCMDDLLRPNHEFVPGANRAECAAVLAARFPSPVVDFTRVECPDGPERALEIRVHTLPCGESFVDLADRPDWWEALQAAARSLGLDHPGLLITRNSAEELRGDSDWDDADLVIGSVNRRYSLLRYRPSRAAARRKSEATRTAKVRHQQAINQAVANFHAAVQNAYTALRADLHRCETPYYRIGWLVQSHPEKGDQHVPALIALTIIHGKFRGRTAYRHNAQFQAMLTAYRELPADVSRSDWCPRGAAADWLVAEARRRIKAPRAAAVAAAG